MKLLIPLFSLILILFSVMVMIYYRRMGKISKIVLTSIIFVGFFTLTFFMYQDQGKYFNHGFCIKCGTKYEAVDRTWIGTTYYECPECYYGCYF